MRSQRQPARPPPPRCRGLAGLLCARVTTAHLTMSNVRAPPSSWSTSHLTSWLKTDNKLDPEVSPFPLFTCTGAAAVQALFFNSGQPAFLPCCAASRTLGPLLLLSGLSTGIYVWYRYSPRLTMQKLQFLESTAWLCKFYPCAVDRMTAFTTPLIRARHARLDVILGALSPRTYKARGHLCCGSICSRLKHVCNVGSCTPNGVRVTLKRRLQLITVRVLTPPMHARTPRLYWSRLLTRWPYATWMGECSWRWTRKISRSRTSWVLMWVVCAIVLPAQQMLQIRRRFLLPKFCISSKVCQLFSTFGGSPRFSPLSLERGRNLPALPVFLRPMYVPR